MDDLDKTAAWRNDPEIKNMALMHPFPVSMEMEKEWFESNIKKINNRLIILGIEFMESNQIIGFTKLYDINWVHRYCYFGIIIGEKNMWGNGIGKETTELMIQYAFQTLNLRKILLEVVIMNEPAINLYKNLGFNVEGTLKNQVFINGAYSDVLLMAIFNNL